MQQLVKQLISNAADLIEKKGWTRYAYARNILGEPEYEHNAEATCFCSVGALRRAARELFGDGYVERQYIDAARQALAIHLKTDVVTFNDEIAQSEEEVVAKFREVANG